jgi:peptidoglycan/xylan/chitin deacetylase (PgdA/CDA1 family)
MSLTLIKVPLVVKRMFPNYIWDVPTTKKIIYLTFDDGPTQEITDWTLGVLKQYNAKATFFCIGNNILKHPDIFKRIIENGHAIGNHTHNHVKGWKTKTKEYLENVETCEATFKSQIPNSKIQKSFSDSYRDINLFRPPYGQIKPKQGKALMALGYKIIMWDVLSFDWDQSVSKKGCLKNVIDNTKQGSIIVFHDSKKASKNMEYALPKVLEYYSKLGYVFESLNSDSLRVENIKRTVV